MNILIVVLILILVIRYTTKEKFTQSPNIHLITYENTNHPHLQNLLKTAKFYGWPKVTVLGEGGKWGGFGTKALTYTDHLKTLPPDDLAVLVDARDVVVNGTPNEFLSAIPPISDKLLVSAEFGCCAHGSPAITPQIKSWMTAQAKANNITGNRFLNAGMVAGRVSTFQRIYPYGIHTDNIDDQNAMVMYWYAHQDDIQLDYNEQVFSNATWGPNEDGYDKEDNRWVSKWSRSTPVFIQTPSKNWNCYNKLLND